MRKSDRGRGRTASSRPSYKASQKAGGFSRIRMVVVAAVLVLLVVVYGSGVAKYKDAYFPNTYAYGIEFADQTPEQVQSLANDKLAAYELHLTGHDMDLNIPASKIKLRYSSEQAARDVLESQNSLLWPLMMILPHDVTDAFDFKYSKKKLKALVQKSVESHNKASESPVDEGVYFNSKKKKWEYTSAQSGADIDASALCSLGEEALSRLQPELEVPDSCVVKPKVVGNEEALRKAADKANELCSKYDIKLKLAGSVSLDIDAEQAAQWINVDDNYEVRLDKSKVGKWLDSLEGLLSGSDERTYVRPDGKVCKVSGGDYAWKAVDPKKAVKQVRNAIKKGSGSAIEIPCVTVGSGFLGIPGADWGKRYADVDIEEQHARFYDDNGKLVWESDVITGVDGTDFETPTGVYTLTEKRSPAALRSTGRYVYVDENGETQVEENHVFGRDVEYWMPFITTFIGFHDAWWQEGFGGEMYKDPSLGSGGCVNLPPEKAKELYGIILPGDVVVVHD